VRNHNIIQLNIYQHKQATTI